MSNTNKNLIVIVGPTAVGKTSVGIEVAGKLDCEILSADSRQIYRELNIGTCKPSSGQLAEVPHHFINSQSIQNRYTVYEFFQESHRLLDDLYKRSNTAMLIGGSGLFIDAVVNGLDDLPDVDDEIRKELHQTLNNEGLDALFTQLSELDPEYAEVVDGNNPRRVIRALEVCLGTGRTFSSFLGKSSNKRNFKVCKIGLDLPREELYTRINDRVDEMVADGLVEEVRGLLEYKSLTAMRTVGYQELLQYFDEKISLEEAVELIKRNTRRYSKRQLTWFKRDETIKWFQPSEIDLIHKYVEMSVN